MYEKKHSLCIKNSTKRVTLTTLCTILLLSLSIVLSACSEKKSMVPNVMGIPHSEAKTVLETAGFQVTEIEADASSILPNTSWNRTVAKGDVFKVNDETYPDYSDTAMAVEANDNKVFIYYAKNDYTYEEPITYTTTPESPTPTEELTTENNRPSVQTNTEAEAKNTNWKQFLKEYEEWVDNYIDLLKKYKENPSDTELLTEYIENMQQVGEWSEQAEKIEIDLANDPEAQKEYIHTLSRIIKKLSEI